MSLYALTLMVLCAFVHATWNLIVRGAPAKQTLYGRVYISVIVLGAIPVAVAELTHPIMTGTAWLCLIGSGASVSLYSVCLVRAYAQADFTVAYPVTRALPVLVVAGVDILRGQSITPAAWVGIFMVAGGCLLAPLPSFRDFHPRRYFQPASLVLVLTALGTVGYSVIDKIAAETLPRGIGAAAVYCYFFYCAGGIGYFAMTRLPALRSPESSVKVGWVKPVVVGVLNYGGYWLCVCVYQLVVNTSYVVAFRQLSIIIGVVMAFVIFRERGLAVRLTGASLITGGLILIALLGG